MIVSGGELVLADTSPTFARTTYWTPGGVDLTAKFASYHSIYRQQLWVFTVVNKLALATARLPLKVYERTAGGRLDARDTPFAKLLRRPNPKHDAFFFWQWTASTKEVYGEALWVKIRDRSGTPIELWPLHPANVFTRNVDGELTYFFYGGVSTIPQFGIPSADIVHFKTYNPDTTVRGMSPIEPLRQTLLNEDAARRATSSFWARGARPGTALVHPNALSPKAAERLKANWEALAGGTDKTGATVVLEEGMEPKRMDLTAEEAQYIETRKLNREEVCAAYDMPPPAVGILDHATFSNIVEQLRSIYRDTMPTRLGLYESTIDLQLRPDFARDDRFYAEFLLDEVLRGAFETRAIAIQASINSAQLTPNEGRALDNRPALEGGDRLYINSTMIPIDEVSTRVSPVQPALLPASTEPSAEAALALASAAGGSRLHQKAAQKVSARAAMFDDLDTIDPATLTAGLNGSTDAVLALLEASKTAGDDVPTFCARLWALAGGNR
jgi:HK97 family phage portal protein